jgi:uncharacterized delta-60 repeat protein
MRITLLFTLLLASIFVAGQAIVSPDSTFNGTGRNIFSVGGTLDFGDNIALQPDGKIIMTGASMNLGGTVSLGVARLNADGSFDNTFGTAGVSLVGMGGMPSQGGFEPEIVIQPDGKILICGYGWNASDDDMFVCRLLPGGSLDPAFGTGGIVYANLSAVGQPDAAYALTTDAAGNIYACGSTRVGGTPFTNDVAIIKLTPSGAFDPAFSGDGKLLLDLSGSWDFGYGIAVRTDGKIIVTGYSGLPANFFAVRLLPDGSYDPAFGTAGKTTVDIMGTNSADDCWGMTLSPDGKIVIVGDAFNQSTSAFDAAIVRLTADGAPDITFSSDGIATFPVSTESTIMRNVIVQPDGKYLVSGSAKMSGNDDYAVLMVNPDGTLDQSFNVTGIFTIDVSGQAKEDFGYGLALQPDGRILLSGNTQISEFGNQKYSVVRIKAKEVTAGFNASASLVCTGQQVQFTNNSLGNNLTYLWTFEGGTPATSTLANPVVIYNSTGFFDVKLVATNGTVSDSITKNNFIEVISTPAAPATPAGAISACGGQTYQYTTSAVLYANSYTWTVTPSTAGLISGSGTTASFSASLSYSGPYTIKVNATGQCGSSAWSGELSCTLNHMPVIFMIEGDGNYCEGTNGAAITLAGSETGVDYQLSLDNQPVGSVVPGTGSAIVWNNLTTAGFYTVTASTLSCSQQMAGQIYVSMITAPVQPEIPAGNTNVCNSSATTYSIFNVPLANSYTWVLAPAGAGTTTPNGVQVSIVWSPAFTGTASLSVTATNDCGTSPSSMPLSITVNNTPVPSVSGLATVCLNWDADYETIAVTGSSYVWTVTGGTIVSGAGTHSVKVNWNTTGTGTLKVAETTASNCIGTSAVFNVAVDACVGLDELAPNETLVVYPNPAQSIVTVKLNEKAGNNSQLRIIDATGRQVAGFVLNNGTSIVEGIDISNLKSGFYTLLYITDGKVVSQTKVVKN